MTLKDPSSIVGPKAIAVPSHLCAQVQTSLAWAQKQVQLSIHAAACKGRLREAFDRAP